MTKPLYSLTHQDIYNIARDSLDSACLTVQHALFNDSQSDFADGFFTGQNFDEIHTILVKYIKGEISNHILNESSKDIKEVVKENYQYSVGDLYSSINDIFNQWTSAEMTTKEAKVLANKCCAKFLEDNQ